MFHSTDARRACRRGAIGSTMGAYPRDTGSNPVEGNGHFFPSYRQLYLSSFFDTHTHARTRTHAHTHNFQRLNSLLVYFLCVESTIVLASHAFVLGKFNVRKDFADRGREGGICGMVVFIGVILPKHHDFFFGRVFARF